MSTRIRRSALLVSLLSLITLSAALPSVSAQTKKLLAPAKVGNKWGFIDRTGKFIIKPQFFEVRKFTENLAAVRPSSKWGFIDSTGKYVVKPSFDVAEPFQDGMAYVKNGTKMGFVDAKGNVKYVAWDNAIVGRHFSDGRVLALFNAEGITRYSYLDKNLNVAIDSSYDMSLPFAEGLAPVRKDGKWGYIDKTNKMVIPAKYGEANRFSEGMAAVSLDSKYAYIDKSGNVLFYVPSVRGIYAALGEMFIADDFKCGCARISTGNKIFGIINTRGELLADKIEYGSRYSEGLAFYSGDASVGYKWGYLDKSGKPAIKPAYDDAMSFSCGLAGVCVGSKYGVINKSGTMVIKPQFDALGQFQEVN